MLEYSKMILEKVSFDDFLFEKELKKAVKNIKKEETAEFETWCRRYFGDRHNRSLNRTFRPSEKIGSSVTETYPANPPAKQAG